MRIFFAAGGTAGHINPAIAIAEEYLSRHASAECLFAAVPGGMEERLVPNAGFPTTSINIHGLERKISFKNIKNILMLPRAMHRAKEILCEFQPNVVIATGGYLSYPFVKAAKKSGIPYILHESNAIPGLVIRKTAKHADKVLLNYKAAANYLPQTCHLEVVGNPIRTSFIKYNRAKARRELGISDGVTYILSFGGSLGAERINRACIGAMRQMSAENIKWTHACGKNNYEKCLELFQAQKPAEEKFDLRPYIDDMARCMNAADVVICRAGAATLAELAELGRAAILIPFPNATADHQTKNAEAIKKIGGCILLEDQNTTVEALKSHIDFLISHPNEKNKMEMHIREAQPHNAVNKICSILSKYE